MLKLQAFVAKQFFFFYSVVVTVLLTVLLVFQILRKRKNCRGIRKSFPKPETLLKIPVDKWVWILVKEQVILFSSEIFVLWAPKLSPIGRTTICVLQNS